MTRAYPRGRCAPPLCLALACLLADGAGAVPPDPQRPLAEQTCAAALDRLTEARSEGTLISPSERAAVLARAEADTLRLCGAVPAEAPPDPVDPTAPGDRLGK